MLNYSQNTEMGVTYFNENEQLGHAFMALNSDSGLFLNGAMKPDPGIENGWNDDFRRVLSYGNVSPAIPRTLSCPPNVAAAMAEAVGKGKEAVFSLSSAAAGTDGSKKRKADKTQNLKVVAEEKTEEKKMKGCEEEESKNSNSKSSTTTATNNKNTKVSEAPKSDYIHVRARRGQATDSHSLAERLRREKISERMKYLQDLVPGCNKITGKAGMLDEIINYVQSLQRQVEFLSMKLAAINPRLDFDLDNYIVKEVFPACTSSIPTIEGSSEMVNVNHTHLQFNTLAQGVSGSCLDMLENPMDVTLRRTISAPVSIPHTFLDSSNLNIQQVTWEDELQNLYQQGRSTSFISQPFSGLFEASYVKMEM